MAAPHPERELQRLEQCLADPAPPQVLALAGAERWFRGRALDLVRARLGEQVQVVEVDGQDGGGQERVAAFLLDLRTANLFGGAKLLLLRNADKLLRSVGKPLAETLDGIAAGNLCVLELAKLDKRTAVAKRIQQHGQVFEFRGLYEKPYRDEDPPQRAELVQWLAGRARTHGLALSPDAALFVVRVVGADPAVLDGELARLAPRLAGRKVGPEELRRELVVSFGSTQFDLVDALLAGDLRATLRSLRALEREGLRDRDGKRLDEGAVFPMVTAWLATTLANLTEGRAAVDRGERPDEVAGRLGGFFRDRFARQLARHDAASLGRLHRALVRAERRLRTWGEAPIVLLERLVLECLGEGLRLDLVGDGERAW